MPTANTSPTFAADLRGPSEGVAAAGGEYSERALRDGQAEKPQMGSTRFRLGHRRQFIYPGARSASPRPHGAPPPRADRVPPVPSWVMGHLAERSAAATTSRATRRGLVMFRRELGPEENPKHFGPQAPTRGLSLPFGSARSPSRFSGGPGLAFYGLGLQVSGWRLFEASIQIGAVSFNPHLSQHEPASFNLRRSAPDAKREERTPRVF